MVRQLPDPVSSRVGMDAGSAAGRIGHLLLTGPLVGQRHPGAAADAVVRVGDPVAAADRIEDRRTGYVAGHAFPGFVGGPAGALGELAELVDGGAGEAGDPAAEPGRPALAFVRFLDPGPDPLAVVPVGRPVAAA